MSEFLKEIEKRIAEILPKECEVTDVDLEGPDIVIYTKNIGLFLSNEGLIKAVASRLKKRFVVRSDSSVLKPPEEAMTVIKETIPPDAGVGSINFDTNFNEVAIEAKKLGLVIGPGGETLKAIASKTGWMIRLLRTPTSSTEIIKGIRNTALKEGKDRREMLRRVGRRIYREGKKTDWIRITGLGGCREVGRSCFLAETPESKVLLDCGLNPASTENAYPYFSGIDFSLDELDAVVIAHGHLDHCGFLPYLFNYGYNGPVYCTPPTRDVMALLQLDFIEVAAKNAKTPPYGEKHVKEVVKHCITREYGEVTDISPDMRLTLHNAGHILGSSIVHLHIGEGAHNLVYSSDLKFGYTKLFDPAETRFPRLETLLLESTYGNQSDIQPPRYIAEKELVRIAQEAALKNGVALVPVFSIGRAQEVMLVFEEFARQANWDIPIYLDGMTREASAIHTVYPEYMRRSVQRRILHNDSPFDSNIFRLVDRTKRREIIEQGRCIILSPAGMLNGGPALEYFKMICEKPDNALIFVGYQSEGTLGRKLQRGVRDVALEEDGKVRMFNVKMRVETVEGFSGHADINQLLGYFKRLYPRPERVLTIHGEEKKCVNFARNLSYKFRVEASAPRNLDSIRLK